MMPPRRPGIRWLAALSVLLFATAAACGSTPSTGSTPSAGTRPSSPATIAILAPTGGSTVTGTTVNVQLSLTGATLAPPTTTSGVSPTVGHIHLSLDGSIVSMTGSLTYPLAVNTSGQHILTAEFVANDHGPFSPRVLQTITFTDHQ